jgi:hypothetical protein
MVTSGDVVTPPLALTAPLKTPLKKHARFCISVKGPHRRFVKRANRNGTHQLNRRFSVSAIRHGTGRQKHAGGPCIYPPVVHRPAPAMPRRRAQRGLKAPIP